MRNIIDFIFYTFSIVDSFVKSKGVILMYHRVGDGPLSITMDNFEKQINYLINKGYKFISLEEFRKLYKEQGNFKKKVLITFDDGHKDNYTKAFPFLKKNNLPAVIFLNTGFVGKKINWKDAFWYLGEPAVDETVEFEFMNWNQIKEMHHSGFEFQLHTHSHKNVQLLSSDEIKNEIELNIDHLKSNLNNQISSFAYTYGIWNEEVIKLLKQFNVDFGFSIELCGNVDSNSDIFRIPRKSCENLSLLRFKILISDIEPYYSTFLKKVKGLLKL
jgi:peptidoglycan/xylan/chitin deacetylase (PgdA/CDA1 family)